MKLRNRNAWKRIIALGLSIMILASCVSSLAVSLPAMARSMTPEEITARHVSYFYNYRKLDDWFAGGTWNEGVDPTTVTDFEMTRTGSATEIHPGVENCKSATWKFAGTSEGAKLTYNGNAFGLSMMRTSAETAIEGLSTTMKIVVEAPGVYTPVSVNAEWANGVTIEVFLAPDYETNPTDSKYSIGTMDTYNATQNTEAEHTLSDVTLTTGVYTLTYRVTGINEAAALNPWNHLFMVRGLKLNLVSPGTLWYNFRKGSNFLGGTSYSNWNDGTAITAFTDYAMTSAGRPEEIHPSDPDTASDPWIYHSTGENSKLEWNGVSYGLSLQRSALDGDGIGTSAALEIAVPRSSTYTPVVQNTVWQPGGQVEVFIAPADASDPQDSQYSVGVMDTYSATANVEAETTLNATELNAGNYIVTFKVVGRHESGVQNAYGHEFMFRSIKLVPAGLTAKIIGENPGTIELEESRRIELFYDPGTGSTSSLTVDGVSASADPSGIVDASIEKQADGKNYLVITGTSAGSATVTVSATVSGKPVSGEFEVTVSNTVVKPKTVIDFTDTRGTENIWDATLETHGWQLSRDITTAKLQESDNVRFQAYGVQIQSYAIDECVGLQFTVAKDGTYDVSMSGGKFGLGGYGGIYVDGRYLGQYDFYDAKGIVDGESINLRSIALTAGTHELIIKVMNRGTGGYPNMYPKRITFQGVSDMSALSEVEVSLLQDSINAGRTTVASALARLENGAEFSLLPKYDGSADDGYSIVYKSENSAIATVDTDGQVKGMTEGKTKILAEVTINGTTKTGQVEINVLPRPALPAVSFDFKKDFGTTVQGATFAVHGWQLNRELTTPLFISDTNRLRFQTYYGIQIQANPGQQVAMDFEVPEECDYAIQYKGGNFSSGGYGYLYIDGKYIAEYDYYSNIGIPDGPVISVRSLHLTEGKHTIVYKSINTLAGGGGHMYPAMLSLQGLAQPDALSEATLSLDKADIAVGESAQATAGVKLESGASFVPRNNLDGSADTEYTVSYRSEDASIATVDDAGVVRGVRPGKTKIITEVTAGGVTKTTTAEVNVNTKTIDKIEIVINSTGYYVGFPVELDTQVTYNDGSVVSKADYSVTFASDHSDILQIEGATATPLKPGTVKLTANVTYNGTVTPHTEEVTVSAVELKDVVVSGNKAFLSLSDNEGIKLSVKGVNNNGSTADLSTATFRYQSLNPEIAMVTEDGIVLPIKTGHGQIEVTVTLNGTTRTGIYEVTVGSGKTESTIYTAEKRSAALENVEKYSWAHDLRESAVKEADRYLKDVDAFYDMIPYEGIPRAFMIGLKGDPKGYTCPYCEKELRAAYGYYPWLMDPLNEPWKIQCPDCRRKFPSNDFASYYESGLDQKGQFDPELAKANGQEYLKNILYPEKGEGWGVDDGFGYVTGEMATDKIREVKTFIPYYLHWGLWCEQSATVGKRIIGDALIAFRDAYLYTNDIRYGRAGAILIDRIADVYPSYNLNQWAEEYPNSDGGFNMGKILGNIWECGLATEFVRAYDAFYPAMEDEQVITYLSTKAEEKGLANPKSSAEYIRENCETGILREVNKGCRSAQIYGNFGMHQRAMAMAAVTLDTLPETGEMIDWIFKNETATPTQAIGNAGGGVMPRIINIVDRDGTGNEVGASYNSSWMTNIMSIAEELAGYDTYQGADLFKNPKFVKMITAMIPQIMIGKYTVQLGDYGKTADSSMARNKAEILTAYMQLRTPELAQLVYFLNDNDVDDLHLDIFTKNPEGIGEEIKDVVAQYGEYQFESINKTGFGLAVMRDGEHRKGSGVMQEMDTRRDFWMFWGKTNGGHAHNDKLGIGLDAFGFNMSPDNGYPTTTGPDPERMQWNRTTISHNTVVVNETEQTTAADANPMHFDAGEKVQVMDVDAPQAYAGKVDTYRRTVVMVDVDDEISYGVDFFRIRGGEDHLYSFHSQSKEITEIEGLDLVKQVDEDGNYVGTYAGADVAWGPDPDSDPTQWFPPLRYPKGYTWLRKIRKDAAPASGNFSVTFKQTDFWDVLPTNTELYLRMTMLNDFTPSEVTLAEGVPPQVGGNRVDALEYVLVRNKGESGLDTLFTTVLEPYRNERYLQDMQGVETAVVSGTEKSDDAVRAIKVTHTSGRVDYIVYATNNTVEYRIDDRFNFRGFVGVLSYNDDEVVYSYLHDGDILGERKAVAAYTGEVVSFTKELAFENTITVKCDQEFDPEILADKYVYVDNDGIENGAYRIESASRDAAGNLVLNIGDTTLIRKYKNDNNLNAGYVYNIAEEQTLRIPLSDEVNDAPQFAPIGEQGVEVGSELTLHISATSPVGRELTYSAKYMPYGANFDPKTQTLTWVPSVGQIGDQYVTIAATDGSNSSTISIPIKVYGSASGGGTGSITNTPGSSNTDKPVEPDKPVVTTEKDEVSFAASADETPAETKLGSVTFADGTFAADGQGKLAIEREGETYTVSVTATVDMAEQPAKVSLNYTPSTNMTDGNCIIVKDENGNIIPNGRYENGKMTFYTESFGKFTIEYNPKSFTDLSNHAWASGAITRLAARGIINGITATTYGPSKNITRADFTTLIVRAFGFTAETASFADVPANAYYAEPVGIAKTLGIVGGVNETDFAPTAEITRQDMMVIVARALEKAGYVLDATENPEFSDIDEVADYAKDAVEILTKSGLIAGSNGKINPKGNTTRAEVAVILDRILFMEK